MPCLPATQQAKGALGLVDHGAANPFGATQRPGPMCHGQIRWDECGMVHARGIFYNGILWVYPQENGVDMDS